MERMRLREAFAENVNRNPEAGSSKLRRQSMPITASLPAAQSGPATIGGDLTVNRMGYGAMRITGKGIWGPPEDKAAALATLRRAVELGVHFIDTADSYGPYVSEELIAEALYPYPKDLVITTKVGWTRHGAGIWQH